MSVWCPATVLLVALVSAPAQVAPTPEYLKPQEKETPSAPEPLRFSRPLPEGTICHVNGQPISESALLRRMLEQNFSGAVQTLVSARICDRELRTRKIPVSAKEVREELERLLADVAPGVTLSDVTHRGAYSLRYLQLQARTLRGWKKIVSRLQNVPDGDEPPEINTIILRFHISRITQGYETRLRGGAPAPRTGYVAEVRHKETKDVMLVGASEALDYVMGMVSPATLLTAREDLIDRRLLDAEMAKVGVKVTDAEAVAWAAAERTKYTAPFTWEFYCRSMGTTTDAEIERWRRIEAWKRVTKAKTTKEQLTAFREANAEYFRRVTKKVSHILVRTVDESTGLALDAARQASAEERVRLLHRKLREGADFSEMAKRFSDDSVTAKTGGRVAAPVRGRARGGDPEFREAAWSLREVGQLSAPVRSAQGWHLIKLDEVTGGVAQDPDWESERYRTWVREEYQTQRMEDYVAQLRSRAKIARKPQASLLKLKHRSYTGSSSEGR